MYYGYPDVYDGSSSYIQIKTEDHDQIAIEINGKPGCNAEGARHPFGFHLHVLSQYNSQLDNELL